MSNVSKQSTLGGYSDFVMPENLNIASLPNKKRTVQLIDELTTTSDMIKLPIIEYHVHETSISELPTGSEPMRTVAKQKIVFTK